MNIRIVPVSKNGKTGSIAVTSSDSSTCPSTCPHINSGCYGKQGNSRIHWNNLDQANQSIGNIATSFTVAIEKINNLTSRSIVRHNEVGDLPHNKGNIDNVVWYELDKALNSKKKKAFTYTHHKLSNSNINTIKNSKTLINISCETINKVKLAKRNGLNTVITVKGLNKVAYKNGIKIVQCPAEYSDIQCSTCGNGTPLCARDRDYTIGFNAHGTGKNKLKVLAI